MTIKMFAIPRDAPCSSAAGANSGTIIATNQTNDAIVTNSQSIHRFFVAQLWQPAE
jgi:hypothetical protein